MMSDDFLTNRSGVHVRQMVEVVDDTMICDATEREDHEACMLLAIAASWPNPMPVHRLEPEEKLISVLKQLGRIND